MKILTKEEEAAHYNATLQGGTIGGLLGLSVGAAAVLGASRRYAFIRNLTVPLKAFLVTSSGTFAGIIAADHASRSFQTAQNPIDREYAEREKQLKEKHRAGKTFMERAADFGREERYKIVGASWLASMFAAFSIVNRNKYMSGQQKLVQARVYAQFLTLGVLVATAAFEISDSRKEEGKYETIQVVDKSDPEGKRKIEKQVEKSNDSGDQMWKDMVAAEERRIKDRESAEREYERKHPHKPKSAPKDEKKSEKKDEKKDDKKSEKKDDKKDSKKDDQKDDKKEDKKDEKKDENKDDGKDEEKDDQKEEKKSDKKDEKKDDKKGDSKKK